MGEILRIALITNYWKKSQGGGIRTFLVMLVNELKNMGIEVTVIFREGMDPDNYEVRGSRFLFPLWSFFKLYKIKPQVIHSHGAWYCLLPGVLYKIFYRCKLIHTFHTDPNNELPVGFKSFFQLILDQCDCVTFVSKKLENKEKDVWRLKFTKTAITYAGVEPGEVSEEEISSFKEKFCLKDRYPILLALGLTSSIYKAEGLKILIESLKEVRAKYPNTTLLAAGEGKYLSELMDFVNAGCTGNAVIFTGNVENPWVPLALCDIYTHISLSEGLPIALLEAMSMGKPIIATPAGGIPEAIEDGKNGLLAEPISDKISEKILYLLQNKEIAEKLGINAKKTTQVRFTWKIAADTFLKIYGGDM